jgi:prolyl oligopeptidase PreP (S9A serine peptidase family)
VNMNPASMTKEVAQALRQFAENQVKDVASLAPRADITKKDVLSLYKSVMNDIEMFKDVVLFRDAQIKPPTANMFNLLSKETASMVQSSNNAFTTKEIVNARHDLSQMMTGRMDKGTQLAATAALAAKNTVSGMSSAAKAAVSMPTSSDISRSEKQIIVVLENIAPKLEAQGKEQAIAIISSAKKNPASDASKIRMISLETAELAKAANMDAQPKNIIVVSMNNIAQNSEKLSVSMAAKDAAEKAISDISSKAPADKVADSILSSQSDPKQALCCYCLTISHHRESGGDNNST